METLGFLYERGYRVGFCFFIGFLCMKRALFKMQLCLFYWRGAF